MSLKHLSIFLQRDEITVNINIMKKRRLIYPLIFICSFWIATAETTALREAEAKRDCELRATPSAKAESYASIKTGYSLQVSRQKGLWYKIESIKGIKIPFEGWVKITDVKFTDRASVFAEEQFQSIKKYLLGLPSKTIELKAKAAKQDQFRCEVFYARMPIQDAGDLCDYYKFNDTPEGLDLQGVDKTSYYGVIDETVGDYLRKNINGSGKVSYDVKTKSADYQGIAMNISLSTDLGKRVQYNHTPLIKADYPPLGYNKVYVVENGKGEKQNELTSLILSGDMVDKIWGVESLSGEKFAQLFVENYFTKNFGSAWSSLVDETIEEAYSETEGYVDIYVWENTRDGYLLKLSTYDKSILLQSIRKESSISFD